MTKKKKAAAVYKLLDNGNSSTLIMLAKARLTCPPLCCKAGTTQSFPLVYEGAVFPKGCASRTHLIFITSKKHIRYSLLASCSLQDHPSLDSVEVLLSEHVLISSHCFGMSHPPPCPLVGEVIGLWAMFLCHQQPQYDRAGPEK